MTERCFTRNKLLLLPTGVFWVGISVGAIVQTGTPWWCGPLGVIGAIGGVALTSTGVWYGRVCVTADGVLRFRDFEWTALRNVTHEFDLRMVREVERHQVWRQGDFLIVDYVGGGELKLNRSTWPKKDLLWLVEAVREHAPAARIASSTTEYAW